MVNVLPLALLAFLIIVVIVVVVAALDIHSNISWCVLERGHD